MERLLNSRVKRDAFLTHVELSHPSLLSLCLNLCSASPPSSLQM